MGGSSFKDFLKKSTVSLDSEDFTDYEILRKDGKSYGAMWNLLFSKAPDPSNTMTCPLHCKDQTKSSISVTESLGSCSYIKDGVAGSPDSSSSNRNIPSESNIDPLPKKVSPFRRGNLTPALVSRLKKNIPVIAAVIQQRIVALDIKKDAISKGSEKLTEESNFVLSRFLKFITDSSNEEFFQEWLETCPDDSRNAVIVDLVRSIIDLKERVKEGKEWVRKTGVEVANELCLDLFELRMLRMEKLDEVQWENEKHLVEKFCLSKFSEMENTLKNAGVQFDFATDATKMLEIVKCSKIREYTEAYKLSASGSEGVWQDIIEKERKCIENLVHLGKRIHQLRLHRDEVEQRMLELKLQVFEKAEAEVRHSLY
ncbi:RING/U-box superfamily protein [Forsythia ovata]|uniref:RING/U-box superfamily protein n=1 Tax=Forsythia ovata TaxID=205694 RepID=A0ABD1QTI7_9LAMI